MAESRMVPLKILCWWSPHGLTHAWQGSASPDRPAKYTIVQCPLGLQVAAKQIQDGHTF